MPVAAEAREAVFRFSRVARSRAREQRVDKSAAAHGGLRRPMGVE
jgi:hypothetical protein